MVHRESRSFSLSYFSMPTAILAVSLIVSAIAGLSIGAVEISPIEAVSIIASKLGISLDVPFTEQQASVLWAIRLPRLLLGVIVGSGLAVAGAVLQSIFRNPLADPGLIGVSTGAAFAVSATIVLSETLAFAFLANGRIYLLPFAAFLGGITAAAIVYAIGRKKTGANTATMLLAGIAVNAFAAAGIGLMSFLATDAQLRNILAWNLGSLAAANWQNLAVTFPVIFISVGLMLGLARSLNIILLGDADAAHLGVNIARVKWMAVSLAALAVGTAVSVSGAVGFVGLVVPHLLRLSTGTDHRRLLLNSALLGAILLVVGDIISRTILAPAELPIGIITAFIGVPFFIWLLIKKHV